MSQLLDSQVLSHIVDSVVVLDQNQELCYCSWSQIQDFPYQENNQSFFAQLITLGLLESLVMVKDMGSELLDILFIQLEI